MNSSEIDGWIRDLYGGDPVKGNNSLVSLIAAGDKAEERLFSNGIAEPKTQQVYRRLYKFIASRGDGIVDKLIRPFSENLYYPDKHTVATMFAGLKDNRAALQQLSDIIDAKGKLEGEEYLLRAWGYAGGKGSTPWYSAKKNEREWHKTGVHAFRAVCDTVSRLHEDDLWYMEQFLTNEWDDFAGKTRIIKNYSEPYKKFVIDDYEITNAANYTFLCWRRGAVADNVIRDWSAHDNPRVRSFGAQILAAMGFQRVQHLIKQWLSYEYDERIRADLYHGLERCDSTIAADALLNEYDKGSPVDAYLVRVAWRASDKDSALAALRSIAARESTIGSEALVSMAKLGCRSEHTDARLGSGNFYTRLNASLSLAYLQDKEAASQLNTLYRESSKSLERIIVKAALAILGGPNTAIALHEELVRGAEEMDYSKRSDLFFMHSFIQKAVLDGLGASADGSALYLGSWMQEFRSFDPIAEPPVIEPSVQASSINLVAAAPGIKPAVTQPLKILFMSAQPYDQSRLCLEFDLVAESLEDVVEEGKMYIMPPVLDANYERLLLKLKAHPNILHFSGHGQEQGICLKNNASGKTELLENAELARVFKGRSGYLQLVLLSSCYSEIQAKLISAENIYALGFNLEIDNSIANLLISKFYLGFCVQESPIDIEEAIRIGCTNVALSYPDYAGDISLWKNGEKIDYQTFK